MMHRTRLSKLEGVDGKDDVLENMYSGENARENEVCLRDFNSCDGEYAYLTRQHSAQTECVKFG